MDQKMMVWNVTPASNSPHDVVLYGKTVKAGRNAMLDPTRVFNYPQVLQSAIQGRLIHMGATLPDWYNNQLEKKMQRFKNKGHVDTEIKGDGFEATLLRPGEECEVEDAMGNKVDLAETPWIVKTQLEPDKVQAPPKEEEPAQEAPPVVEKEPSKEATKAPARKVSKKKKKKG